MRSKVARVPKSRSVFLRIRLVFVTLFMLACGSNNGTGTLVVNWTINSTSDAALCNENVGWVVVKLKDTSGNPYASNGPCYTFSTVFNSLASGSYTLSAYMFNFSNDTTLSTLSPQTVNVDSGSTTTLALDFPITTTN